MPFSLNFCTFIWLLQLNQIVWCCVLDEMHFFIFDWIVWIVWLIPFLQIRFGEHNVDRATKNQNSRTDKEHILPLFNRLLSNEKRNDPNFKKKKKSSNKMKCVMLTLPNVNRPTMYGDTKPGDTPTIPFKPRVIDEKLGLNGKKGELNELLSIWSLNAFEMYLMSIREASWPLETAPCREVDMVKNIKADVELHPEKASPSTKMPFTTVATPPANFRTFVRLNVFFFSNESTNKENTNANTIRTICGMPFKRPIFWTFHPCTTRK